MRDTPSELLALRIGWSPSVAGRPAPPVLRAFKNLLKGLEIFKRSPTHGHTMTMEYNPKVVFGYDCFRTNRSYKYRHFKNGLTWRDLHLRGKNSARIIRGPQIMHTSAGDYVVVTDENGVRFQKIGKPNQSKARRASGRRPEPAKPAKTSLRERILTPLGPVMTPPSLAVNVLNSRMLPKTGTFSAQEDGHIYLSYLGGQSTVLPAKHHKKYWYFLRKKGAWRFSEHHPYGDEHRLILADASKGIFPLYDQEVIRTHRARNAHQLRRMAQRESKPR
jgi:hypothetical protein